MTLNAEIFDLNLTERPEYSLSAFSECGFGYGFGGAEITDIARLLEVCRPGDIVFFGVDREMSRNFGGNNPGAATFVRERTFHMMPWTQECAAPCHDIGIVSADKPEDAMQAVRLLSRDTAAAGWRPALIGCDHTVSLAAATGVAGGLGVPFTYLYLDAHYDLGLHSETPELHNGNFVSQLLRRGGIENVVNAGGRCSSIHSPVYRDVPGFISIPGGVDQPRGAFVEHLSRFAGSTLYVSIDADVLDPSCAPNVACQEPFGMSARELFSICEWLGKSCNVIGADLCEIVPSDQTLESEKVLMRCLHALLPRRNSEVEIL